MTYGEAKKKVLRLIFSKEIAGEDIAETYNCQADYIDRIPSLIDSAQYQVATTVKKINEVVALEDLDGEDKGDYIVYDMPSDCYKMVAGGLFKMCGEGSYSVTQRISDYRIVGNKLFVPKRAGSGLFLEYWRFPKRLGENPREDTELDNTPEVQEAVLYYASAYLIVQDDYFQHSLLKNEFEGQLQRMSNQTYTETSQIRNVYEGFNQVY